MIPITYEHLRERAKAGFKQLRHDQPGLRTGAGREPRNCFSDGEGSSPYAFWTEDSQYRGCTEIYVNYDGGWNDGEEATLALARRIIGAMTAQGLRPVWDGSTGMSIILPPLINRGSHGRRGFTNDLLDLMREAAYPGLVNASTPEHLSYSLGMLQSHAEQLREEYVFWTTAGQGWVPEWWKRSGSEESRGGFESGTAYPTPEPWLKERV